jgi:hypothetical protein
MPQSEEKRHLRVCARMHARTAAVGQKYCITLVDVCTKKNKMEQEGVKHTIQGRRHSLEVIAPSHNEQATSSIHLLGVLHSSHAPPVNTHIKCAASYTRRHWHRQALPPSESFSGDFSYCTIDSRLSMCCALYR